MSVRGDILSELAGALAELYSDQASVRAMGLIAGLTLGQISFDSRASNTWVFLLTEAEAQRRTQAVFDRAKAQHPMHEGLDSACRAYVGWIAAGRRQCMTAHDAAEKPYRLNTSSPPSHFVGRAELVRQLADKLCAHPDPTLALHGSPGVGKSTLAAVLATHPEVKKHFVDGVLWAGLGPQAEIMSTWCS